MLPVTSAEIAEVDCDTVFYIRNKIFLVGEFITQQHTIEHRDVGTLSITWVINYRFFLSLHRIFARTEGGEDKFI